MNKEKVLNILRELKDVNLVVASKYLDSNGILDLYNLGIKNFGENRVDAFLEKYEALKSLDITWHFIGHLQTNKAKKVINKISYLHSLDSLVLADIIESRREEPLSCFVEVHLTSSETKNGVPLDKLDDFINSLKKYKKINLVGLMTMSDASQSDEEKQEVFRKLNELKNKYHLKELSMGMSNDYKLALLEGATYVRLGRIICE